MVARRSNSASCCMLKMSNKFDLTKHRFGINKNMSWDEVQRFNLNWWKTTGIRDWHEKPSTKKLCYDVFIQDIESHVIPVVTNTSDKLVGEVCCGPYGGIIEAFDIKCKEKYFIDLFMEDYRDLGFVNWSENSFFVQAPAEYIDLEDNKLDILFGYNSIDHGWDWKRSLDECLRISKSMFLMFDTKDELDGDKHPQKISHQDVLDYVSQNAWREKYQYVSVHPRRKDYGYYETCFEWPETWVYVIK